MSIKIWQNTRYFMPNATVCLLYQKLTNIIRWFSRYVNSLFLRSLLDRKNIQFVEILFGIVWYSKLLIVIENYTFPLSQISWLGKKSGLMFSVIRKENLLETEPFVILYSRKYSPTFYFRHFRPDWANSKVPNFFFHTQVCLGEFRAGRNRLQV